MAILSWGKCTISKADSASGTPGATWTELPIPREGTTQLTTTAGEETEAREEGGGLVDYRAAKNTYTLEFDLFVKKDEETPFEYSDGVVEGEFAFRVVPEDEGCWAIQIDRAVVRVEDSFTSADGALRHVVVKPLMPATGNTVKYYKPTTA